MVKLNWGVLSSDLWIFLEVGWKVPPLLAFLTVQVFSHRSKNVACFLPIICMNCRWFHFSNKPLQIRILFIQTLSKYVNRLHCRWKSRWPCNSSLFHIRSPFYFVIVFKPWKPYAPLSNLFFVRKSIMSFQFFDSNNMNPSLS